MQACGVGLIIFCSLIMAVNLVFAQTWAPTSAPSNYWQCVASSADGTLLVAGANPGGIYISTNSGTTWQSSGAPSQRWFALASSFDGKKLIAGVSGGFIYTSTNSGITWTHNTNAPNADWRGIASSADGERLAAAAWNGRIYTSTNSGATWITNAAPIAAWAPMASSADGNTLAVGIIPSSHPFVYSSTNAGISWVSNGLPFYCEGVAASADGVKLVASVLGGGIYASTNSGNTWALTGAPDLSWRSVASSADGSGLIAVANYGSSGQIYTSTDSGVTWVSNNVASQAWNSAAVSADGCKAVAVAANVGFSTGPVYTAQTTPVPQLNPAMSNNNLILSWTLPSTNFVAQQSSDLSSWTDLTNTPALNFINLQEQLTLVPVNCSFFRLVSR